MAADSMNVVFTRHAEVRMKERHITRLHVLDVLRHGVIRREPEPDLKTGHIQCRMERLVAGRELGVVLALDGPSATAGIVITALLIGD
jgi:Domain of unknown function (DUF4258)